MAEEKKFSDSYLSVFISKKPCDAVAEVTFKDGSVRKCVYKLEKNSRDYFGNGIEVFYSTPALNFGSVKDIKILTDGVKLKTLWK